MEKVFETKNLIPISELGNKFEIGSKSGIKWTMTFSRGVGARSISYKFKNYEKKLFTINEIKDNDGNYLNPLFVLIDTEPDMESITVNIL
jgi:hypothetical protein